MFMNTAKKLTTKNIYHKFEMIDGSHPLKKVLPDGYIDYPARLRRGGKISYFNFELAKEMGLIPAEHENKITHELESKILETFAIQIINEFDQQNNRKFPKKDMKSGTYMATRYLQLQHEDKKGKQSGDGRSIWNGQVSHQGRTWDISSCGTGGTCLSPATSKYNTFFETGDPSVSYGCGYAELDEGLATALMSRIFKYNGTRTEQSLAIIEFDNNISINVRSYLNLIRPSHFFLYLKQDRFEDLKNLCDYYIAHEVKNQRYQNCPSTKAKYDFFLKVFTQDFAELVANLEDQYIFCWLDWDGDNILMDGGIIDYGSIRQFGLFHNEYRYDDIERFSTNLSEQKQKAKLIVQNMIQAVEFIKTGQKSALTEYANHAVLSEFETIYEDKKNYNLLYRLGLSERKIKQLLKREPDLIALYKKAFSYFEKYKSYKGEVKVSDGVNTEAIFSMRNFLRELPQLLLYSKELTMTDILDVMKTEFTKPKDLEFSSYAKKQANILLNSYKELIQKTSKLFQEEWEETLLGVVHRSQIINMPGRMTGDAITHIVDLMVKQDKSFNVKAKHKFIEEISRLQVVVPENVQVGSKKSPGTLVEKALHIFDEYRDGL